VRVLGVLFRTGQGRNKRWWSFFFCSFKSKICPSCLRSLFMKLRDWREGALCAGWYAATCHNFDFPWWREFPWRDCIATSALQQMK
jgi:hypothetical protein